MAEDKPDRKEKVITLAKSYVGALETYSIDGIIRKSLNEGDHLTLDLTDANQGVNGEFYGNVINIFKELYDTSAFDVLKKRLTLRLKSQSSPAYRSLRKGYADLFTVEFYDRAA
jgi:hypothetical protein